MFDLFSETARTALLEALAEATERNDTLVDTEHVLVGLVRVGSGRAQGVLAQRSITVDALREAIDGVVGPPPSARSDSEALATIGIDLDEVKGRLEETFGAEALVPPRPYSEDAKRAIEQALTQAEGAEVDTGFMLLGLLSVEASTSTKVLAQLGIDVAALADAVRSSASGDA